MSRAQQRVLPPFSIDRYPCRRAIADEEVPHLQALGQAIRDLRFDGDDLVVGIGALSQRAQVPPLSLRRIERGVRRTRRSTLARIATAAAALNSESGPADTTLERLVTLAGPSLAPESPWQKRIDRRRKRRYRRGNYSAKSKRRRSQGLEHD